MRLDKWENAHNNICKNLDMNFVSIKNMKWELGKMYKISFEIIKHVRKLRNQQKTILLFSSKGIFWFPPLHPTTFLGDALNSKQRRSSELGGNEWAWWSRNQA